jgi:hypothetical protein
MSGEPFVAEACDIGVLINTIKNNIVSKNDVFTPHFALNFLEIPKKTAVFDDFK